MNKKYICVEEFPIYSKDIFKNGTVKVGTTYELIKEPTSDEKKYHLMELVQKETFVPKIIRLRKNDFKKFFKEVC